MIQIIIKKKEDHYESLKVEGHSNYASFGEDIVCSAVSALTITIVNGITEIAKVPNVIVESDDGFIEVILPLNLDQSDLDKVDLLISTLILGLKEIRNSYPKQINIKVEEI